MTLKKEKDEKKLLQGVRASQKVFKEDALEHRDIIVSSPRDQAWGWGIVHMKVCIRSLRPRCELASKMYTLPNDQNWQESVIDSIINVQNHPKKT